MPVDRLTKPADQLFIDDVLVPSWDPSGAFGFDPDGTQPGDDAFFPVATSLDEVGEFYPHVTVTRSNETSGGETTYDFLTDNGPGQQRDGQLVVTVRAEDDEDDYVGDSQTYSSVTAERLVDEFIAEVESVVLANAQGGGTDFSYLGSQRGADAPDDFEPPKTVRIAQCTVSYGWVRA